jgi:hypothetical protein
MLLIGGAIVLIASVSLGRAAEDAKKIEAKSDAVAYVSPVTIDFQAELGVSYPTLASLGLRIDEAYREVRPVELLLAARDLELFEKIAEKKAEKITPQQLRLIAIDMLLGGNSAKDLKASLLLVDDPDVQKKLKATLVEVEDQLAAAEEGEAERGIANRLYVHNRTPRTVRVRVDWRQLGYVGPYQSRWFYVGNPGHLTLRAMTVDNMGCPHFWQEHHDCHDRYWDYHWTLSRYNVQSTHGHGPQPIPVPIPHPRPGHGHGHGHGHGPFPFPLPIIRINIP